MILIGAHFSGIMLPAYQHPPFGGIMGVQISGRGCSNFERLTSTTLADFERHGIPKSVFL
jgi:hypothetical protein